MLKILLFTVIEDLTVKCYNYCKKSTVFEKYHQKTFRSLNFSRKKHETVKCVIRMCPHILQFLLGGCAYMQANICAHFEWRSGATTTEYANMATNTTNTVSPAVVLKVIVSIYRSNTSKTPNEPCERYRSRMPYNAEKHNNLISFKKDLQQFLGLKEQALALGIPNIDIKLYRLARTSGGKTENYLICTQDQWSVELPLLLGDENSDLNGESWIFDCTVFLSYSLYISSILVLCMLRYLYRLLTPCCIGYLTVLT